MLLGYDKNLSKMRCIEIYHNPRCSKSRAAIAMLTKFNLSFKIKEYLKEGLSLDEIKLLSQKLNLNPIDFVRKKEPVFKLLNFASESIETQVKLLHKNPELLERPIVVLDSTAIIARPAEKISEFIISLK